MAGIITPNTAENLRKCVPGTSFRTIVARPIQHSIQRRPWAERLSRVVGSRGLITDVVGQLTMVRHAEELSPWTGGGNLSADPKPTRSLSTRMKLVDTVDKSLYHSLTLRHACRALSLSWNSPSLPFPKNVQATQHGTLAHQIFKIRKFSATVLTFPCHSAEFCFQTRFGERTVHFFNAVVDEGLVMQNAHTGISNSIEGSLLRAR